MLITSSGKGRLSVCLLTLVILGLSVSPSSRAQERPTATTTPAATDADPLKAMQWRLIGPFRGGRSDAVAGVASQPLIYYFGATGGGVWKTVDG